MARSVTTQRKLTFTILGWAIGLLIFFPILWTFLTSFKTEGTAVATPPQFLFFDWTLENYHEVQSRSDYMKHVTNSVVISVGSTLIGLALAIPAAWATRDRALVSWQILPPTAGIMQPLRSSRPIT